MQKYNTKQKTEISVIISKCKPYDVAIPIRCMYCFLPQSLLLHVNIISFQLILTCLSKRNFREQMSVC